MMSELRRVHVVRKEKNTEENTKKGSIFVGFGLFLWTSQGLNLGPPDYESRKVIFHEISLFASNTDFQRFTKSLFSLNLKKYP